MINTESFAELLGYDEDEVRSFSRDMITEYLESSQRIIEQIDEAINQKQLKEIKSLSHYLKGSSGNLGFTLLFEISERLQKLGNNTSEPLDSLLLKIKLEYMNLVEEFNRIRTKLINLYTSNDFSEFL